MPWVTSAAGVERVGPDIFQSGPIIRCGARAPPCVLLNTGNDGMFAGLSGGLTSLRSWLREGSTQLSPVGARAAGGQTTRQRRLELLTARGATSDGIEDEVEPSGEARVVVTACATPSGAPEGGVGVGLGLVKRFLERSPARRSGGGRLAAGAAEHVGEEEVVCVLRVVLVQAGLFERIKDRVGEA